MRHGLTPSPVDASQPARTAPRASRSGPPPFERRRGRKLPARLRNLIHALSRRPVRHGAPSSRYARTPGAGCARAATGFAPGNDRGAPRRSPRWPGVRAGRTGSNLPAGWRGTGSVRPTDGPAHTNRPRRPCGCDRVQPQLPITRGQSAMKPAYFKPIDVAPVAGSGLLQRPNQYRHHLSRRFLFEKWAQDRPAEPASPSTVRSRGPAI